MSKFFKALLVSAATTGIVAYVYMKLQEPPFPPPPRDVPPRPVPPDPDQMSADQLHSLTDELASQL